MFIISGPLECLRDVVSCRPLPSAPITGSLPWLEEGWQRGCSSGTAAPEVRLSILLQWDPSSFLECKGKLRPRGAKCVVSYHDLILDRSNWAQFTFFLICKINMSLLSWRSFKSIKKESTCKKTFSPRNISWKKYCSFSHLRGVLNRYYFIKINWMPLW